MKFIIGTITTDAERLWSCAEIQRLHGHKKDIAGKVTYHNAGKQIRLEMPPITPSPFCDAPLAWNVPSDERVRVGALNDGILCQHQVEVPD